MSVNRSLLILLAVGTVSVGACAEAAVEPSEAVNRAPTAEGTIPDRSLSVGAADTLDVSAYFSDPDGDALTYAVETSDAGVATAAVSGNAVVLAAVAEGVVTVSVTARDPGGASATQSFSVSVFPFLLSVTVSPSADTIAPSQVLWLTATARDVDGEVVEGVDFKWMSSNATAARIMPPSVFFDSQTDSVRIKGELEGTAVITATGGGASGTATLAVVNPDPAALTALYTATGGPDWKRNAHWLSDEPMARWDGVEVDIYHRVVGLRLQNNALNGEIPTELGQLTALKELALSDNPDLSGPIPGKFGELLALRAFTAANTRLCVPPHPDLLEWLDGLDKAWIRRCDMEATLVYLTQAVQSRSFPVPLVAGDPSLLRVFPLANRATDAGIPPVRATFHLTDGTTRVVEIPGSDTSIPTTVSEALLSKTANAEIDGALVQPGLEIVIEIDPEGTLDPELGVTRRIPEDGRIQVDVRAMPVFRLTLIPFLLNAAPDSSVLAITQAMADNPLGHLLLGKTRTLLPVGDMEVVLHDPVVTSSTASERVLAETDLIRVMEAGIGHYLGTMSGPVADHHGRAYQRGRSTFSVVDRGTRSEFVIAHELGHNMSLQHPPGCGAGYPDNAFPHSGGKIGAWGYDFRYGGVLVPPGTGDLMSYCDYDWISDYHFTSALKYRLADEGPRAASATGSAIGSAVGPTTRSLLLWGGVGDSGEPYLEPAFLVDRPAVLPESGGAYEITGRGVAGEQLFSLNFDMAEVADGDGSGSFAFVVPVGPGWGANLVGIRLSGPGGTAVLDRDTDHPVTILRDSRTGRVRGILRDLTPAELADADVVAPLLRTPGVEVQISRGMPEIQAWRRDPT